MNKWLQEMKLSEQAATVRRTLTPAEFTSLQLSIERLSLVTSRPIAEVAERLLCSYQTMLDGDGPEDFISLVCDVLEDRPR